MKLKFIENKDLDKLLKRRKGEVKLGEKLNYLNKKSWSQLDTSTAKYVILGVEEDLGPKANLGNRGSNKGWESFFTSFINIQHNSFLHSDDILILGSIKTGSSLKLNVEELREAVKTLDNFISPIIQKIVESDKIPIVIGGGHNNCYPIIKGTSIAKMQAINCINCDPHADFRQLEGRHSGNGFSYAKSENYLTDYRIIGLHENYNSSAMLHEMQTEKVQYYSFEDIFIREKIDFTQAIKKSLKGISNDPFGVELDMDAIEGFPASATTPSGISPREARQYVSICGASKNASYLHLPETAPSDSSLDQAQAGKLLSYVVSDFIKANQ